MSYLFEAEANLYLLKHTSISLVTGYTDTNIVFYLKI